MNEVEFPCLMQVKEEYLADNRPVLVFFDAPMIGTIVRGHTGLMMDQDRRYEGPGWRCYAWDMEVFEPYASTCVEHCLRGAIMGTASLVVDAYEKWNGMDNSNADLHYACKELQTLVEKHYGKPATPKSHE